ncbi:MAG: zinc ribbon domain-containing protein [Chloroflexi bacterium]|nr:MAG: zinc ribbon domain-containing protein [Chloroflexota bacterium]
MPLYEFYCPVCRHNFDVRRSISQGTDDVVCPTCASQNVQRVFTPVAAFSSGAKGVTALGGSGCATCALTNCTGCPGARRR